jgi:hypothetical protein
MATPLFFESSVPCRCSSYGCIRHAKAVFVYCAIYADVVVCRNRVASVPSGIRHRAYFHEKDPDRKTLAIGRTRRRTVRPLLSMNTQQFRFSYTPEEFYFGLDSFIDGKATPTAEAPHDALYSHGL